MLKFTGNSRGNPEETFSTRSTSLLRNWNASAKGLLDIFNFARFCNSLFTRFAILFQRPFVRRAFLRFLTISLKNRPKRVD